MSRRAAPSSGASQPRVLVVDGGVRHEVFEVVSASGDLLRVRSAYLFELGEELTVRIERDGSVTEATARVRSYTGPDDARITELELAR